MSVKMSCGFELWYDESDRKIYKKYCSHQPGPVLTLPDLYNVKVRLAEKILEEVRCL